MGVDTHLYLEEKLGDTWYLRGKNYIKRSTTTSLEKHDRFVKISMDDFEALNPDKETFDDWNMSYPWDTYLYTISPNIRIFMISLG